jgi:hypothetical protein
LWKYVTVKHAQIRYTLLLKLHFLIHLLPVSSGLHFYTHAFRSLLRVFYALLIVHDTLVRTRNCRMLQRHFRDVTLTPATITDITLSRMARAGNDFVPRIRHSLPTKKVQKGRKGQTFSGHTYPTVS